MQVKQYTGANPNADGIVPDDINKPAICYKADGTGPTFTWNTSSHVWQ